MKLKQRTRTFLEAIQEESSAHPFEAMTAGITAFGVVAAIATLWLLIVDLNAVRDGQDSQAYANIYQSEFSLDQYLATNPDVSKYFEEDAPMPSDVAAARKVKMAAEFKLDVIDFFFSQGPYLRSQNYEFEAWRRYFERSFRHSKVLCEVLRQQQLEYGAEIKYIARGSNCSGIFLSDKVSKRVRAQFFSRGESG